MIYCTIYGAGVWRGGGGFGIVWANRHTIKLCFDGAFAIVQMQLQLERR